MYESGHNEAHYDGSALAGMRQRLISYIVSFFLECLLFGTFIITYTTGTCALLRIGHRGRPSARDWCIYAASTIMILLALTHLALSLKLMLLAFVNNAGSLTAVTAMLYNPPNWDGGDALSSYMFRAKFAVYVTQTLIGDAFMGYRLYVVWNGRMKILAVPALLFFTSMGTGYGSLSRGDLLDLLPMVFSAASCLSSMLFTVLVMWRILSPDCWAAAPPALSKRFDMARKAGEAIVQSAAVYCIASMALVLTYFLSRDNGWTACLNVFPPLIGLVFSFIVKRIARHSVSDSACTLPPPACKQCGERVSTLGHLSPVAQTCPRPLSALMAITVPILDPPSEPLPAIRPVDHKSLTLISKPEYEPSRLPDDIVYTSKTVAAPPNPDSVRDSASGALKYRELHLTASA
ncbi:hypothetical protein GY45DRAFT_499267 [Cubamyces sp. BRFM 1775]|nr:hypothetical protein GY45DRAFT_499267 [Cubamyces sp. BRFM 1775]